MHTCITANTTLDGLRKQAKVWLKALRAGEPQALQRLLQVWPTAPDAPGLRDIQHALAREYGTAGWHALRDAVAESAFARKHAHERIADFLELACLHYGVRAGTMQWNERDPDLPSRWQQAARLLGHDPGMPSRSIHAAAACGDLTAVRASLARDPSQATLRGGHEGWEPLLFLCYSRVPDPRLAANSVAIATALLDAGADVDATAIAGDPAFFALTGTIGGGESSQPPHPAAPQLADLLIARGANPYDRQALYNTSLEGDDPFWLEFLYRHSAQQGEAGVWSAPAGEWPRTGMLDYLLGNAVTRNALVRARWLLAHGANAQAGNHYGRRPLLTEALLLGYQQMAALLREHGAIDQPLSLHEQFLAACMRLDRQAMHALAVQQPAVLLDGTALLQAAARNRTDIAAELINMGMSVNVRGHDNYRPLHAAATAGAVEVAQLLLEHGADIDPLETRFGGAPLGWALHHGKSDMIALLGELSRRPQHLVQMANIPRLRELFDAEPALAHTIDDEGSLFAHLPDDEDAAIDVAAFLLCYGVDASIRNRDGLNAIDAARKGGRLDLAELLAEPGTGD